MLSTGMIQISILKTFKYKKKKNCFETTGEMLIWSRGGIKSINYT